MDEQDQKADGSLLSDRADEAAAPVRVLLEGETVWLTQKFKPIPRTKSRAASATHRARLRHQLAQVEGLHAVQLHGCGRGQQQRAGAGVEGVAQLLVELVEARQLGDIVRCLAACLPGRRSARTPGSRRPGTWT
ncbi:hypothetical protein [Thiohalocapsa halophila]